MWGFCHAESQTAENNKKTNRNCKSQHLITALIAKEGWKQCCHNDATKIATFHLHSGNWAGITAFQQNPKGQSHRHEEFMNQDGLCLSRSICAARSSAFPHGEMGFCDQRICCDILLEASLNVLRGPVGILNLACEESSLFPPPFLPSPLFSSPKPPELPMVVGRRAKAWLDHGRIRRLKVSRN